MLKITIKALIASAFVASLTCGLVTQAQNSSLSPPAKRKFKHHIEIKTEYDQTKDETMVFTTLFTVQKPIYSDKFSRGIRMSTYFIYPGRSFQTPRVIYLGFQVARYVHTYNEQYEDNFNLSFETDGTNIDLGAMKVLQSSKDRKPSGDRLFIYTVTETSLPYEEFLKLANARNVKMKVGNDKFELQNEALEVIRDFATHTVP